MNNKENVIQWGIEKGIVEKSTPLMQATKTLSEINELFEALIQENPEEVKDAYGDILVTIILGAHMYGLDIEDCLQSAYDVISKRKGKMVDGLFVKEN